MLHIVTCFWNAEHYIVRCIESILEQSYSNYMVHLIDDISNDKSLYLCKKYTKNNSKFKIIKNNIKKYKLKNLDDLISGEVEVKNDDIVVELDGDDYFAHKNVLENIYKLYNENKNILILNGKYNFINGKKGYSDFVKIPEVRYSEYLFSHLRTWKASLWRAVDRRYFIDPLDPCYGYFKTTADMAYSLPMLEIAGQNRYMHHDEVMVIYNDESPFNEHKPGSLAGGFNEQIEASKRIRLLDFGNNLYFDKEKINNFIKSK